MKNRSLSTVFKLLVATLLVLNISSCSETDIDRQAPREKEVVIDALSEYTVLAKSSPNIAFNISANTQWFIKSEVQWCKVSPTMSSIDGLISEVIITIEDNTKFEQRETTLTITADGVEPAKTINIIQNGAAVFKVTSVAEQLPHSGGGSTFSITSSEDWTLSANKTWLKFDKNSGEGSNDPVIITATADPSSSPERNATVTISNGFEEKSFVVVQAGQKLNFKLIEDLTTTEFIAAGGTLEVAVESTMDDWEILCDNSNVQIVKGAGDDSRVATITVGSCSRFTDQIYTLTLESDGGSVIAAEPLILSQKSHVYDLNYSDGSRVPNADGSITLKNLTSAASQSRIVTDEMKLGTYIFTFSDIDYNTEYFFNFQGIGDGTFRYNISIGSKKQELVVRGGSTLSTTVNIESMTDFKFTLLPDETNPSLMNAKVYINNAEEPTLSILGVPNVYSDPLSTGIPIYFGMPRSTVAGSSMTIESFDVIPYNK